MQILTVTHEQAKATADALRAKMPKRPNPVAIATRKATGCGSCNSSPATRPQVVSSKYGPGTELLAIYKAAGVPTCDECVKLANRMNNWGPSECRNQADEIVAEILPRAMAWLKEQHPWAARLLPQVVSETAASIKIRADVMAAIVASEAVIAERLKKKRPSQPVRAVRSTAARHRPVVTRSKPESIQLIGVPINRDRLKSHILFHVMPLAGQTEWVWRKHCQQLRDVREQFNGRLIVGIVTPGMGDHWSYHPPDAVKEELRGLGAEYIEAPNDTGSGRVRKKERQGSGEGVLYPRMLEMLKTDDPDEIAFYRHCKGVTRKGTTPESAVNLWSDAMHETLFCNHDAAVKALDTHGICGPFRMRGGYRDGTPGIGSFWFYSGTFFAFRLVDAFRRNWRHLPTHYGCVEQWPRLNFSQKTQAACLFYDGVVNLYDDAYWRTCITPALEKWRQERGTSRAS